MSEINVLGVLGTGVIGAGWVARALARGLDVAAWDPAEGAEKRLREALDNAWPALERVGLFPGASIDRVRFMAGPEDVAQAADFIQESAPERIDLKTELHARADSVADASVIIASSTSGLLPSEFQSACRYPQRVIVGHPFNPVYLLPLVEVLGGKQTATAVIDTAISIYSDLGMYPLKVRTEVPGFLSDRLQEALWRELLHLVNDDVATPEELDAAISYGPGLRWAIWGTCLIFHLAGGPGGMRQMLKHFDPALFPWTRLEPPVVTDELVEKMATGCERQAGVHSIAELEQVRDQALIGVMQALQSVDLGAGRVLNERRQHIRQAYEDAGT
ncbi:MAG: L-carnitine dehydrogenase [Arenicellales bacterium]|nr:3-hydroxybutyryl-CoA dehydrogenase [Acidiferrobacteraceae bacterium]MDP6140188.1 L-carnitine dehydrogenase [Arenicellales bacterium]HCV20213.1 L-carnitine dehydrogenase [Gammaproteobacteria bacterium]MDP6313108.1 L-carnitine dehydrogenase [Arenicellales bacterium]MDP7119106.1 L-carnitine dehydrogenase [Arenicellales bacterium]